MLANVDFARSLVVEPSWIVRGLKRLGLTGRRAAGRMGRMTKEPKGR